MDSREKMRYLLFNRNRDTTSYGVQHLVGSSAGGRKRQSFWSPPLARLLLNLRMAISLPPTPLLCPLLKPHIFFRARMGESR